MYENIKQCIENNTKIDMSKVPVLIIEQKCQRDLCAYYKYHNIITGDINTTKPDNAFVCLPGTYNKNQGLPYVKYYEDYELLEISLIQFNAQRDKNGGVRELSFAGPRVFFDKNKDSYIYASKDYYEREKVIELYTHDNNNYYRSIPSYDHRGTYNSYPNGYLQYLWAISKLGDSGPFPQTEIDKYCNLIGLEKVESYFLFAIKFKEAKKSPMFEKIENRIKKLNELTRNYTPTELKELSEKFTLEQLCLPNKKPDEAQNQNDYYDYILQAEKLSDDIGMVRILRPGIDSHWVSDGPPSFSGHYELTRTPAIEMYRLFITPTEVIELKNQSTWYRKGEPIPTPKWDRTTYVGLSNSWRRNIYVEDFEKLCNCQQRIKYLRPILEEVYKDKLGHLVYEAIPDCLRHPAVEQLIKMGCPTIGKRVLQEGKINAELTCMFGPAKWDNKTTPIFKKLGINKEQLSYIEKEISSGKVWRYQEDPIYCVATTKRVFGITDFSSLTLENFKYKVKEAQLIDHVVFAYGDLTEKYLRLAPTSMRGDKEICNKLASKIIKIALKNEEQASEIMRIYRDGLSMYEKIQGTEFEYNYDFSNLQSESDIVRFHDACLALDEARRAEQRRLEALAEDERNKELEKKMERLQKKRKEKFPYEDETFLIKIPEHLSEITTEGAVLHHCVGGYVNDHASGRTNIMFLRKKSEPDKQFYTVEVKDNEVVQIHGANNKWLGCDPEAIPFIKRWIRDKGFICPKKIYLSKSTGYWANDTDLVPDPEI